MRRHTSRDVEQRLRGGVRGGAIQCAGRPVRRRNGRLIDQRPGRIGKFPLTTRKLTGRNLAASHAEAAAEKGDMESADSQHVADFRSFTQNLPHWSLSPRAHSRGRSGGS